TPARGPAGLSSLFLAGRGAGRERWGPRRRPGENGGVAFPWRGAGVVPEGGDLPRQPWWARWWLWGGPTPGPSGVRLWADPPSVAPRPSTRSRFAPTPSCPRALPLAPLLAPPPLTPPRPRLLPPPRSPAPPTGS